MKHLADLVLLVLETLALWSGQDATLEPMALVWRDVRFSPYVIERYKGVSLYKHPISL